MKKKVLLLLIAMSLLLTGTSCDNTVLKTRRAEFIAEFNRPVTSKGIGINCYFI